MSHLSVLKKLSALLFAFIVTATVYALPAVTSFVPDTSGEYVYYRDNSFKRPSYIGFIYYDDATYAVRYYAPAVADQALIEKDITLYLSVNKNNEHLEFTGETMKGVTSADDTEIVNYMHDLFYELTARRQKVTVPGWQNTEVNDDFAQFGGNVKMTYTALVPIFNLRTISAPDGTVLLQTQTTGLLTKSSDQNFVQFKGLDTLPKDTATAAVLNTKAKRTTVQFEGLKITIDKEWSQSAENVWYLNDGNSAIMYIDKISAKTNQNVGEANFYATLLRKACESVEGAYILWPLSQITVTKNVTKITNRYYLPANDFYTHDFIMLKQIDKETYGFYKLTTSEVTYQKYAQYFEKILNSIK